MQSGQAVSEELEKGRPATDGLKGRAVRGGFAKICSQGASFVLRLGSLMILGRLLEPEDFGLVGMVTAITGVLSLFRDFGLSTATVQRAEITEDQISALFWINVLVGVGLALAALAISPFMASFYGDSRLLALTAVLSLGFLFNAVGVQHMALLQRSMRFTAVALIDIVSLAAGVAAALGMAFAGYGYWSLVAMSIVLPLVSSLCAWTAAKWIPSRPRRFTDVRPMVRFGGALTLNTLVMYVGYNADKVLLGRFWGATALGIYGRAYQLINIPTENLNGAIGGVAFSTLARLQGNPQRLKAYFLKGYSVFLALTLPITIGCAVFSSELILVVLGDKWLESIPIFRYLSPTIVIFAIINPFGWLLFSMGLVEKNVKIAFTMAPLLVTACAVGLRWGPEGVALAFSAGMALWVVPHILWCIHGTVVTVADVLETVSRPMLSGLVASAVAIGARILLANSLSPLAMLVVGGGGMVCTYLGMLVYVMGQKAFYQDLIRTLLRGGQQPAETEVTVTA